MVLVPSISWMHTPCCRHDNFSPVTVQEDVRCVLQRMTLLCRRLFCRHERPRELQDSIEVRLCSRLPPMLHCLEAFVDFCKGVTPLVGSREP